MRSTRTNRTNKLSKTIKNKNTSKNSYPEVQPSSLMELRLTRAGQAAKDIVRGPFIRVTDAWLEAAVGWVCVEALL